jgi:hypothetical protein
LGDVPLTNIDVKVWLEDYIKQNLESLVETQKNKG